MMLRVLTRSGRQLSALLAAVLVVGGVLILSAWASGTAERFAIGDGAPTAPFTALLVVLFGAAMGLVTPLPPHPMALRLAKTLGWAGALAALLLVVQRTFGVLPEFFEFRLSSVGTAQGTRFGHTTLVTAGFLLTANGSLLAFLHRALDHVWRPRIAMATSGAIFIAGILLSLTQSTPLPQTSLGGVDLPSFATAVLFSLAGLSLIVLGIRQADRQTPLPAPLMLQRAMLQATAAGCLCATSFIFYRVVVLEIREVTEIQSRELAVISELTTSKVVLWRTDRVAEATRLQFEPALHLFAESRQRGADDRSLAAEGRLALAGLIRKGDYDEAILRDSRGEAVLWWPALVDPADSGVAASVSVVVRTGRPMLRDFFLVGEGAGRPHLAVMIPVGTPGQPGLPVAVLELRVDVARWLYPMLEKWPIPSLTAENLLIRRDGNRVTFLAPLRFDSTAALRKSVSLADTALLAVKAALGQSGLLRGKDYRGQDVLGVLRAIPDSPWFLVSRIDLSEVVAAVTPRLWELILLGVGGLLGLGASLYLFWKRLLESHLQVGRKLAQSTERLLTLFEGSSDGLILLSPAGDLLEVNESFARMHGSTRSKMMTMSLRDLDTPGSAGLAAERMKSILSGVPSSFEVEHLVRGGGTIALEVSAHRVEVDGNAMVQAAHRDLTERRREEAARVEFAERRHALVELSPDIIFTIDDTGRIIEANQAASVAYGYSFAELIGMPVNQLRADQDSETFKAQWRESGDVAGVLFQAIHRRKDGSTFPVEVSAGTVVLHGRRLRQSIVRDITARVQQEVALRESDERYRTMVRSLIAGIVTIDGTGTILDWNDAATAIFQYLPSEIIGQSAMRLMPAGAESAHADGIARVLSGGERHLIDAAPVNVVGRRKDGSDVMLQLQLSTWESGGRRYFTAILRDMTTTRALDARLALQSSALEAVANAVLITDGQGRIEWVNHAFTTLTGYSAAEAIGGVPGQLLKSGKHAPEVYRELWNTILAGRNWHGEMINRRKDGSLYTERMTITPLRSASGELTHFIAVKQDISKEKLLEIELQQSQRLESVGQLAGGVAHDFNNMLAVILGNTDLALGGLEPSQHGWAELMEIRDAAARSAELTRQLLTFARKQLIAPSVMDINTRVPEFFNMLRMLLGPRIVLEWTPASDPWLVKLDATQLHQMITNLCVNARDAIAEAGTVSIRVENVVIDTDYWLQHPEATPGHFVSLLVSDDGCGMSPETAARICEPFYTTKAVGKGTGLGMSTVHGAVAQNGGFLTVSTELGVGTTVALYLPRYTGAVLSEAAPQVASSDATSATILLVEDEPSILKFAKKILEGQGHTVLPAASAAEALRQAGDFVGDIDLLVTDVIMPDINGLDLADALIAQQPGIKVLFMSGYTAEVIAERGILQHDIAFLQKPFVKESLLDKVQEALHASAGSDVAEVDDGEGTHLS